MAHFNYMAKSGEQKSVEISVVDYKAAQKAGMNLAQYLERKYGADADTAKYGSVFRQACQSVGIYDRDSKRGIQSPTIAEVLGDIEVSTGSITSPDGSDSTPAGRILYPEVVMNVMREKLQADESDVESVFGSMIALDETINSDIYVQPLINTDANENVASQPTSQLALPPAMVNITTSQVSRAIQTKSIGLMISEQALNHASLDLVALAVTAQSRGERIRTMYEGISSLLNGDVDSGMSALTQRKAQEFDSAITSAGEVTHKAFLHMLYDDVKTRSIDSAIMSLDTYLAFEARAGRPTVDKDRGTDGRADVPINRLNWSLSDLNVLLVDEDVLGANTALMFSSAVGIRRVTNLSSSYSAIENFVMRRGQGLRIDSGSHICRIYDEAFLPVSLTV